MPKDLVVESVTKNTSSGMPILTLVLEYSKTWSEYTVHPPAEQASRTPSNASEVARIVPQSTIERTATYNNNTAAQELINLVCWGSIR